jgi:2-polyprenyl-6-methoxyphenol hydroxylase-like FAD-dependent oxidoreductase
VRAHYDVVVVGGGPVGVGLALDLGLRGVSCVVLERRTELSRIPKGQGLSQRTMEHMWRWGVVDQLRAARTMPPGHAIGQVTVYESLLGEFWHAPPGRELVQPYYFQANERLPQYRTEEVLRRRVAELPDVDLRLGVTATGVQQDAAGVRVHVERDGEQEIVSGSYVVGCDGGHSLVRQQTDIERSGTDFGELVALVVFRSPQLHEALKRFPGRSTYRVMHPDLEGYWMFFGRVDVGEEFFFHAPVPRGAEQDSVDVRALLHRAAGFAFECEVEHVGFWDLRVQVAQSYRAGRAFLAGDAAHTHPPYGGFGLNNGLEDAVNLSWKLAAVLHGWGGDALLASYSEERQPVFRDVGEDIIGGWIRDDRQVLEQYSPQRDREEFARRFEQVTKGFGQRLRRFEPHYEGSPVVLGPPGGRSSAHGSHVFTARPGHHLPPRPLTSGRDVFDALGQGFTLLALDADDEAVRAIQASATAAGVPLDVVRDSLAGGREQYCARLVLVRPDQFVAWAGDVAPGDPDALLSTVTGRA